MTWFVGAENGSDKADRQAHGHRLRVRGEGEVGSREEADALREAQAGRARRPGDRRGRAGLSVMAFFNFLLFVLLACLEVSDAAFIISWIFCLVSSLIAPACLIKYQFDLFIVRYEHKRDKKGGRL